MEDRLKALEVENASLRKYNDYHQVVHEIDHMSDLHVDSSFYKQSMKLDNYFKINIWIDFSIGQSTVLQELNKKRPKLSNSNQTQNRRRYVNFENGSHFICSFNLNSPETTVCIAFRLNSIASGNNLLLNGIIGNSIKYVAFYKTHSGLGLLISTAYDGSYVAVANYVHIPNFEGVSGSEDRGGGDNSIQVINFGRVGDKSFKEWLQKIGGWKGGWKGGSQQYFDFLSHGTR